MSDRFAAVVVGLTVLAGPFGLDLGEDWTLSDVRHLLDLHPPAAVERWLYNPRERTARGLERVHAGDPEDALELLETAGRLDPDDPRVLYNLGTGRLVADHGDAVGALEGALRIHRTERSEGSDGEGGEEPPEGPEGLAPELRQRAFYNLGNARMADGDHGGAVAAYEEALRLDPSHREAKFNLELALRRLDEERLRLRPPREAPGGRRPGEEEPSEETGGTGPGAGPDEEPEGGREERERRERGPEAETEPREGAPFGRRPLAGFEEQADLTAAQAAALLEAVEHLERRQRHAAAARAARGAAAEEEDW